MKPAYSLRIRLVMAALLWVLAGMVAAFFLLSSIFRQYALEQFHHELDVHVQELQRLARRDGDGRVRLAGPFSDPRYDLPRSGYYWEIKHGEQTVLRSPSLGDSALVMPKDPPEVGIRPHHHRIDGPTGQLFVMERLERGADAHLVRYLVGTDKRELDEMVRDFNQMLILALTGLGLVLLLAAAGLVYFGLAPFTRLAGALRQLRAGDTATVEGRFPREVTPLVDELNQLLDASRENLQQARIQAGNLAHGLRGALSVITDEAYQITDTPCRETSEAILAECKRMQRHIDHHLARARAAAVARMPGVRTPLSEAVETLARAIRRINQDSEVALTLDIEEGLCVALDPQDFDDILGNLLENAYRHAKSQVRLTARLSAERRVTLQIDDDGPGLPVEAFEVVLQPGARWDETRSGSGLGLAIVKEMVTIYEGALTLDHSPLGGLRVEIAMPGGGR